MSLDVSQDCCLGMAVRLTMATSRFLSLTYCQLVLVDAPLGRQHLAAARIGYGSHGNVIRRIFLCTVIMLCANTIIRLLLQLPSCMFNRPIIIAIAYIIASTIAIVLAYTLKQVRYSSCRHVLKLVIDLSCRPILRLVY